MPARYEVVVRALVDERQIVYMGFVIATRIIVGLLLLPVYKRIDGKSRGIRIQSLICGENGSRSESSIARRLS